MAQKLYHYRSMELHYLDENEDMAVYYRRPKQGDKPQDFYNPWVVYELKQVYSPVTGWHLGHKKVAHYADLYSAICYIRQIHGYMV